MASSAKLAEEVAAFEAMVKAATKDQLADALELFANHSSCELRNDRRAALAALRCCPEDGRAWPFIGEGLRDDRAFVFEAMSCCPMALQQLHEDLRSDREVVAAAVKVCGNALQFASEELRSERSFASFSADAFRWCSGDLRADKEAVLAAVRSDHCSLVWAADPMQSSREVVLAAVATSSKANIARRGQQPYFLTRVSEELLGDKSFVIEMVKLNPSCLWHLPENFQYPSDKEVVLEAAQRSVSVLRFADDKFTNDRDVVMATVRQSGEMLALASPELRGDREVVMLAVVSNQEEHGDALEFASDELRGDKAVVAEATRASSRAYRFAADELRNDADFALFLARELADRAENEAQLQNGLQRIYEGTTKLLRKTLPKENFIAVVRCCLAQEGESDAPTLTISRNAAFHTEKAKGPDGSLAGSGQIESQKRQIQDQLLVGLGHGESEKALGGVLKTSDDGNFVGLVATTMGGTQFDLPPLDGQATLGTLAESIVRSRPDSMQAFKRAFLLFEDDPLSKVSPWKWGEPLKHYLPAQLG